MNFKKYHVSKNLLSEKYENRSINGSGAFTIDSNYDLWLGEVVAGQTYTISNMDYVYGFFATKPMPNTGATYDGSRGYEMFGTAVVTVPSGCTWVAVRVLHNANNAMLNTGSQPLPYEPYSSEVWHDTPHYIHKTDTDTLTTLPAVLYPNDTTATVGLKGQTLQSSIPSSTSPVMPQGTGERTGNLFDKNGEVLTGNGSLINITGTGIKTIVQSQGNNRYSTIKLDNELLGKTITISSTITQSANNKAQIRLFYVNGRYATSLITAITTAGQTGHISTTYTMPSSIPSGSDGIAIVLSSDKEGDGEVGDYVEYADLMIVEGSTALPYEPYGIKIPISSADTTTPVYLGEVQTTRRVKKLVLTGTEEKWNKSGAYQGSFYLGGVRPAPINLTEQAYCSHAEFTSILTYARNKFCFNGSPINLNLWIGESSWTVDDFKTYLQQQYAAGTPVTVWYVLAEPDSDIVNEPLMKIGTYTDTVSNVSIPVTAGGDTLSVSTTVQPSEVTVNYKGWHPVQNVHECDNGAWT